MKRNQNRILPALLAGILILSAAAAGCGASAPPGEEAEAASSVPEAAEAPEALAAMSETAAAPAEDPAEAEDEAAPFREAEEKALAALTARMNEEREALWVYKDYGLTENHFTQKAKIAGLDPGLVRDMDENWQEEPYSGTSCIRCGQRVREGDWGGWLFLNGYLPEGESMPRLNDGTTDGQGLDLTGASSLRFYARGEEGGEAVEFFTCGFGYDGETGEQTVPCPGSSRKKTLGRIRLTPDWQEYVISLEGADLSSVICGFGFVLAGGPGSDREVVFYLDEIRFTGPIRSLKTAPLLLRSYDTDNVYIRNTAFTYDNALAAMAFLAAGRYEEARILLDALVYAAGNDRALDAPPAPGAPLRIRNGYASGDIAAWPGWESGARLSGWYDREDGAWYEDRYQVGSNTGNTAYAALALLQYYRLRGGDEYLETAASLMNWVLETCQDEGDGFIAGFDGWEEGDPPVVYPLTYKSIEHNIDAYAAFRALYSFTGEDRYREGADSALRFIRSMYDPDRGLFLTGTGEDGKTPNRDGVVLDAQVWCAMALGQDFAPYEKALETVAAMETPGGGYPFCRENRNGGWWAEGTAYTALMYRETGDREAFERAMKALVSIQAENGLFPAATTDHLSTGIDLFDGSPWEYTTDLHIAPTAWFILAAEGFDPYRMD